MKLKWKEESKITKIKWTLINKDLMNFSKQKMKIAENLKKDFLNLLYITKRSLKNWIKTRRLTQIDKFKKQII